jgi:hypothetical protein
MPRLVYRIEVGAEISSIWRLFRMQSENKISVSVVNYFDVHGRFRPAENPPNDQGLTRGQLRGLARLDAFVLS